MKVLQVIPYFFVSWAGGGPVELILNMSKGLVQRGHQVIIYTTDSFSKLRKSKSFDDAPAIPGIDVFEFRSLGGGLMGGSSLHLSPSIIPALAKQTASFDIIHLHEYRTFQNIVAHHYARKFDVPYVLQAHGSLPTTLGKKYLKQTFDNLWGYRLLNDAARLIAVSRMEAEQYRAIGVKGGRVETVPHGLDLSVFDKLPARGRFRQRHGLDNRRIILSLGRLHRIKGLDLLVRAFAELTKSTGNVRLVIAGPDAGYLPFLKKLVADLGVRKKILFTGPIYGQQKLEAYVDADVYVLPSYYEIFSVTVLEACACGTPVVVTDRCGLADVIEGHAGVVAPCDEKRLASAILSILSDDEFGKQLSTGGRRLVREGFSLAEMAENLERVYLQASRGSSRSWS